MLALARSDPRVSTDPAAFDVQDDLFNVQNGTLDLRTGELRPHRPGDLLTKQAPVRYDPAAGCPRFLKFLDRIMAGNADMIRFLQRALGYSMTGHSDERLLFIMHGDGSNGKSTLVDIISSVFGNSEYCKSTPSETLLRKRDESGIPNDVAALAGCRLVYAQETNSGRRLDESKIKALTSGGERVSARFLHGEYFDFRPQLKLWLSTNNKPRITGDDAAIWTRIRLIPFSVTIPEAERIPRRKLVNNILATESSGILNWCLAGAVEWYSRGLGVPAEVIAATAEYHGEQDTIHQFLSDRTVDDLSGAITSESLYAAYEMFCKGGGVYAVSLREFNDRLARRGCYKAKKTKYGKTWRGLRLVEYQDDDAGRGDGGDAGDAISPFSPHEENLINNPEIASSPSPSSPAPPNYATGAPAAALPADLRAALNGVFDDNETD